MLRKTTLVTALVTGFGALAAPAFAGPPTVLFVDDDAALGGNGATWATAYRFLQDAIAASGPTTEIRIAGGTYTPDLDEAGNVTALDRLATFTLMPEHVLRGGYRGLAGGGAPDDRDVAAFPSVLSGDLAGDDTGPADDPTHAENSTTVVTGTGVTSVVLDGLTISGGFNDQAFPLNDGGGLRFDGGSGAVLDCTFAGSYADDDGGGVWQNAGTLAFTDCAFEANVCGGDGGAFFLHDDGAGLAFTACTFTGNVAERSGGAVAVDPDNAPPIALTDCTFETNTGKDGGAVYLNAGAVEITRGTFTGNIATCDGGALLAYSDDGMTVTDSTFRMNHALTGAGGAVDNTANPVFTNCTFELNTAADCGGAWYQDDGDPVVDGCRFLDNEAGRDGGGWFQECEDSRISNTLFEGNRALDGDGGGIAICCGNPWLVNVRFVGNSATGFGGAVFNEDCTWAMNCVFSGNTAADGGAWAADNDTVIANSSFCGNVALSSGGAVVNTCDDVQIDNCILWGNAAGDFGDEIATDEKCGGTEIRNSDVRGSGGSGPGWDGSLGDDLGGNIDVDPQFVNCIPAGNPLGPVPANLRLQPGSPAIDMGMNALILPDTVDLDGDANVDEPTPLDFDLTPRVVNGVVDMGAFENPIALVERAHPGWNRIDNAITLTGDQPAWWALSTGTPGPIGSGGLSPFPVLDPGNPPGRPDPDGTGDRVLRGYVLAWAVDAITGEEIRWNHLSGDVTIVDDRAGAAWTYGAWAFPVDAAAAAHGAALPTPGTLEMDGAEYALAPDQLVFNFQAAGATGWSGPGSLVSIDTGLTLVPADVDLRQETGGPVTTKASFDVWNENEVKFSGADRCVSCWDRVLLSNFGAPNHFSRVNLQTDGGKARIDGLASQVCNIDVNPTDGPLGAHPGDVQSVASPLLGVAAKRITINQQLEAMAGGNLFGIGTQEAAILVDVSGAPPESTAPGGAGGAAVDRTRTLAANGAVRGRTAPELDGSVADPGGAMPLLGPGDRATASEKGSLLVFPLVDLRWNGTAPFAQFQETYLQLSNDYPGDVRVQLWFVNGDPPLPAP